MRIGIDIDGVITDLNTFYLDYCSKYSMEQNRGELINPNAYITLEMYDWGQKIDDEFWNKYMFIYSTECTPRRFASEITKRLSEDGHEIYIITARSYTTENTQRGINMRKTVIQWLKKHNIVYDKIIFSSYNKIENCRKNKIDIMIEDSQKNINQLSEEFTTICFDTRYNQNVSGKNIIRCYSWYDIYNKIKNIQKMA